MKRILGTALLAGGLSVPAMAGVVVSEIQYDPVGGATNEFVELLNAGTNAVDIGGWFFADGITYTFPSGTILNAGAYLVVVPSRDAFAARYPAVTNLAAGFYNGQLNNGGERLALADAASNVVFEVIYNNSAPWPEAAAGLGSSLVLVDPAGDANDPANWRASAELHGSPGGPGGLFVQDVVINEILAHTDPPQEDAIELKNLTTNAIDIGGWYLSDENIVRKKYRFPDGTTIPAQGYRVVYQAQMSDTNQPVPFTVSSKGDDVYLSEADGTGTITRYVDQVQFDPTRNGVSVGRWPDGTGDMLLMSRPTFGVSSPSSVEQFRTGTGATNAGLYVGEVVINEIMYHPPESNTAGRLSAEYIELYNRTTNAVPLYNPEHPELTWMLTGGISFTFPTNVVLGPGQFLLVLDTNDMATFRSSWGIATNVQVLGPFSNGLNNAGDTVSLRCPNNPEAIPTNPVAYHYEDQVKYKDALPWPLVADGLGGSLERTDPQSYGGTAENWHSQLAGGTPGATNSTYFPPGSIVISELMAVNRSTLRDEDGDFSDWIELYNTRSYDISLGGWYLTDQSAMPTQWTFPPVTIPSHGYLRVFCSQKNRTNDVARLHTNFALDPAGEFLALFRPDLVREFAFDPAFPPQSADVSYGFGGFGNNQATPVLQGSAGRYLVPTNDTMLATNWMDRTFDDAGWLPATNGLGYDTATDYLSLIGTDLQAQMYKGQPSAFSRFPFAVSNSAGVAQMVLRVKYDDGFIAWLNGSIVALGNAVTNAAWNALATTDHPDADALVFTNFDLSSQVSRLVEGTNVLALQLLNGSTDSSDLLLLTELQLTWSGGPTSTAGYALGYLQPPTPGVANAPELPGVAPAPVLSDPGGVFTRPVLSVTVTCAGADAEIRYTLDGSTPTTNSPLYTTALSISSDTELRARAFLPGLVPSPIVGAVYRRTFLGVNEILPSNATATPEMWDFTDYGDWIELYNAGGSAINLGGYYLSDSPDQPFQWRIPDGASIPAGGYFLVWADGYDSYPGRTVARPAWPYSNIVTRAYHANFKLGAPGEFVGLYSTNGSQIDVVSYGPASVDISYGRYPNGSTNWGYFGEPTAGTNNAVPMLTHNLYRAPAVTISPTDLGLIVTSDVQVVLSSDPSVTAIRYTTNGSIPTSSSLLYTQSFTIATSTVIRARAYASDRHPGPVATRTFLRSARVSDLPTLALAIDPKLLYDSKIGMFANLLKDREIPGNIQLFLSPSTSAFQIDAGFKLFGLNTFLFAQKPLTCYLDAKYGTDLLGYQLFPEKPIGFFDRFVLRNGNDDWPYAFLRDTLGQTMLKGVINNATQGYRPCAIYLNGAYYGLINIQEKADEMYCVKNYGVELANVDFFENEGFTGAELLDAGTDLGWNSLMAFISSNSLANPTNYAWVKSQVDIEDMIDYVAAQTFVVDTSWNHNRKWWRDRNPGGKWRWCFVDLDRALLTSNVNNNLFSTMASGMVVFHECLNNTEFRAYCAQRLMAHFNSSFSTNRIIPIIDNEASRIRSEITQHIALYSSRSGIASLAAWDAQIESIRSYARQRPAVARQQIANYFGGGTAQVQVETSGGSGRVLANHVALNTGTNILAGGLPVQFQALPDIGQQFVRWEVVSNVTVSLMSTGSVWRYNDAVTNEIPGWMGTNYDDSGWASGRGQLGYSDGDETTTIGYGPDANNRYVSTYFRSSMTLPAPSTLTGGIQVGLLRDDGAVIYVNGREVIRDNLPLGTIAYNTLAVTNVSSTNNVENTYWPFLLSATNFVAGPNTLAAEVHQIATNSADFGFDMQLSGLGMTVTTSLTNGPDLVWTPVSGQTLRAVFAPAGASLVPSVITSNTVLTAAGSPYYATGDIFVPSNTTLRAEAGVEILMPEFADIRVQGQLQLIGTTNAPVRVLANTNANAYVRYYVNPDLGDANEGKLRWGGISFDQATHTGELVNVVIRGASLTKTDPVNMKAAVSARYSDLWLDGVDLDDVQFPIFVQEGNSTVLQNSRVHLEITGDGINIKRAAYARVENCEFLGAFSVDADAIDYDGVHGGIVRGNRLHDFMGDNDDAMDIGELVTDLLVESNVIWNISDKGVSIGQGSTGTIRHNLMRNCTLGLGIKDAGSYGLIEYNTFHKTTHGVSIYEKNRGVGGGAATIRANIFSETLLEPVTIDSLSTGSVSYCLSDTVPIDIAGVGNILAQPQFLNAEKMNFALQTGSAAIDAGPPGDPSDPDGSRADIGAVAFDWREGHVVISEIQYHPADSNQSEYVELCNPGGAPIDLSGYRFNKGFEFTFPSNSILETNSYLVIAAATNGLTGIANLYLWTTGTLDNAGETLELQDAASNEVDHLTYGSYTPWPSAADGMGPSLSLINARRDNALPENWYISAGRGSPAAQFDNFLPGDETAGRFAGTTFRVSSAAVPGVLYSLEFTESLTAPDWQPVGTSGEASGGQIVLEDVPASRTGFYRIRVIVP